MPPHTADTPRADAPADTPRAPATVNITFRCRGVTDVLEKVSVRWTMGALRKTIAKALKETFGITAIPAQLRLKTYLKIDGEWPTEEAAETAATRPTVISKSVATELEGIGAEGRVHVLVELPSEKKDEEEKPAVAEEKSDAKNTSAEDGDISDVETAVAAFNAAFSKRVTGRKRKTSTAESTDDTRIAFSDVTEAQANAMYEGMERDNNYDIETTPLPEDIKAGIREDYARLVGSMLPPWDQNEVHKRRYIDAVLSRLIFAVNESTGAKDEATKLLLFPEYPITLTELNASGAADWVIKRGERMLVVIEAKQCDIKRGQYQLLAMMEALRIHNKKLNIKQHKIQAICTDFQNWLFVERESRCLRKKLKGTVPAITTEFDENLLGICERVYTMLLNL